MDAQFWYVVAGVIVLIVAACGVALVLEAKRHNRSVAAQLEVVRADPRVQAGVATAREDLTALQVWLKTEFGIVHERLDAAASAASAKGQLQVGQTAFDQWDAIGPFWATSREIQFDGRILRTGDQPPLTFKSQAAGPGGNVPVTRES